MERSRILGAGVWTAIGLTAAFAVVSANSNHHRATSTTVCSTKATSASASDCCVRDAKAAPAVAAVTKAAPKAAPKAAVPAAPRPAGPVGVNGMVIAIDPETGELGMPNAQQMSELQALMVPGDDLNYSDAGLTPVRNADGSVTLDLQGRFQEYASVQVTPGGKKVFGCSDKSNAGLPITPSAPAALEEK
ncbi:MAG: hypothetical protein ABI960_00930 [Candidatus Eisenbacteria bacterium]